ncbi:MULTISPECIES: class II aldolase/adducin family protein [Kosmotoga]|uniref:Class II aldolase/adducin family protein n=1 Tax=Kosmotoga olearia (strain ATCC BAA-1733 / DSM 21960 / TBF 19.5.1) TaxID=521045 RepID=C5CFC4_KOSOT|nr:MULTISPECIES: class II aldolase/adducin family protein [Kosmotoga]ACR80333.1 class II aldolase/adducin family protein [Kosmotoga olearia TBF 19.5.1]MDI3524333.1 L-fuculose-phosphate aldolase [Kosmotoga sp.]MDK2953021.1 L-fuculose-phosphate aldolase [Kosmotoga sp.]
MYEEYKKEIVEYGRKILNSNHVVGTSGNISVRIGNTSLFAITPSGMPYEELTVDDIPIIDVKGERIEGTKKPSIEVRMHGLIYEHYPDVRAIVHTHSVYTTVLSLIRKPLPIINETMVMVGDVPVAEFARTGSLELAENVTKALKGRRAVILANHGLLCVGKSLKESFALCEEIERDAQIYVLALSTGMSVHIIPEEEAKKTREWLSKNYGQ